MINGILTVPDHPAPLQFNPNRIRDLAAADPAAGIDLIQPPEANARGTAEVSHPIRLPAGRGAFSPRLELTYSSARGNGWLGMGWDLAASRIEVDTRWGVPFYEGNERYLLDGAALVPIAHDGRAMCRLKGSRLVAQYARRIEKFERIVQCRTGGTMHWEVTDRGGTLFSYGVDDASRLKSYHPDQGAHIAAWFLRHVTDASGNFTEYTYQTDSSDSIAGFLGEPFVAKYLRSIVYTSHPETGLAARYRVQLQNDCASRTDLTVSGRTGFKVLARCRLTRIDVQFITGTATEPIRAYDLTYSDGAFGKSLLASVMVRGADGSPFYEHRFDYSKAEYETDGGNPFGVTASWPPNGASSAPAADRLLTYTTEKSHNIDGSVGVGFGAGAGSDDNQCSASVHAGINFGEPSPEVQLADLNGDGVPDRIWRTDTGIAVALGRPGAASWAEAIPAEDLPHLGSEDEWGGQLGIDAACPTGPVVVSGGADLSFRKSGTNSLLADVDGDGISDLMVGGDKFHRGLPRSCRDGKPPANGVCGDGLQVCTLSNALCFVSPPSTLSASAPEKRPVITAVAARKPEERPGAFALVKNNGDTFQPDDRTRQASAVLAADTEPPNRHTALGQRLAADPELAKELYRLDPVIRWDAPHKGRIFMFAAARRRHRGTGDGVEVSLLRVWHPRFAYGTQVIATSRLVPPDDEWQVLAADWFDVEFGVPFHIVVDTVDDVAIDEHGTLLDEVELNWMIFYDEVCPLGLPCRKLSAAESEHLGPTGQPAYVFEYPRDFRLAELPRDVYWRLLPPLSSKPRPGADVPTVSDPKSGRFPQPPSTLFEHNRVTGIVTKKNLPVDTPVHVRVRCESLESTKAGDGTVCPLGTVLAERVFARDEIGSKELEVLLPSPFAPWFESQASGDECRTYAPDNLHIVEPAPGSPWYQVTDGGEIVAVVLTEAEATQALALAQRHTGYCSIRKSLDSQPLRFWIGSSGIATDLGTENCLSYRPDMLRLLPGAGSWLLMDGDKPIEAFSIRVPKAYESASRALEMARRHLGRCFIGTAGNPAGLSVEYWKPRQTYQPVRLLFEVDGENGYEIPPEAIDWTPVLHFVSIEQVRPPSDAATEERLFAAGEVDLIDAARPWREQPPVLFRVHPMRQLKGFRAAAGSTVEVSLDVSDLAKPLAVTVFGENFSQRVFDVDVPVHEGAGGVQTVTVTEQPKVITLPGDGTYYVRAYTEAGFVQSTRIGLKAQLLSSPVIDPSRFNSPGAVPVNLLTALFGGQRYRGVREPLPALVGEVPYSHEPWAGGHQGFFYGQFNGEEPKVCIGSSCDAMYCHWFQGAIVCGNDPQALNASDYDVDGDGYDEAEDRCPFAAEDFDADRDDDGCPEGPPPSPPCGDKADLSPDEWCSGRQMRRFAAPQSHRRSGCFIGSHPLMQICPEFLHPTRNGLLPHDIDGILDGDLRRSWTFGISVYAGLTLRDDVQKTQFLPPTLEGLTLRGAIGAIWTDLEVMDWNGDGVLDVIDVGGATLGGTMRRIELPSVSLLDGVRNSLSTTVGVGLGGKGGAIFVKTKPGGTTKSQGTVDITFDLHATAGITNTTAEWIDVNGDSLPDVVRGDDDGGILVRLNLGTRLAREEENWGSIAFSEEPQGSLAAMLTFGGLAHARALTKTDNLTTGLGIGGSFGIDAGPFGGGGSGGLSDDATLVQSWIAFVDINGDGLRDRVSKDPTKCDAPLHVRFNRGGTYGKPTTDCSQPKDGPRSSEAGYCAFGPKDDVVLPVSCWSTPPKFPGAKTGFSGLAASLNDIIQKTPEALELSGSQSRTYQGKIRGTLFGITGTLGYSYSSGQSHVEMRLDDMDGDGLTDRVLRTGDERAGAIQVQRNRLGGANLLTAIHQPLGGRIDVTYKLRSPTEDDPEARWLMETATWRPEDDYPEPFKTASVRYTFAYQEAYYDRFEREFYGFRIVRSTRGDGRIDEWEYFNRDYRRQGLLRRSEVRDATRKLRETIIDYELQRRHPSQSSCTDALALPLERLRSSPQGTPCEVWFARPASETVRLFEGSGASKETAQYYLEHDSFGNLLSMVDVGDEQASDDVCALFTHDHQADLLDANIVDRVTSVEMKGATRSAGEWKCNGARLRFREADYDGLGRLVTHRTHADVGGAKIATLSFSYDTTGFMTVASEGSGYSITYVPDGSVNLFAKETRDSFGLVAKATHDLRSQLPTEIVDANGERQTSSYDTYSRLASVAGPHEIAAGIDSATFEYSIPSTSMPAGAGTTNCAVILPGDGVPPRLSPDVRCEAPGVAGVTVLRIAQYVDALGRNVQQQTDAEAGGVIGKVVSGRVEFDDGGRLAFQAQPYFRAAEGAIVPLVPIAPIEPESQRFPTRWQFDALDRRTRTDEPGEAGVRTTTAQYAIADHPRIAGRKTLRTTITDPEGRVREEHVDSAGRIVSVVQNLAARRLVTAYQYRPAGELAEVRDALGRTTTLDHDLAGRRTAVTTPDTGRLEMVYDANGNLREKSDPVLRAAGAKVEYGYVANRLISVSYPGGTLARTRFIYGDSAAGAAECPGQERIRGRVCAIEDASGRELRSYGALGEVIESVRLLQGELATVGPPRMFATSFVYDSFGRMLWLTWPDGERLRYTYDGGGRVKTVSSTKDGKSVDYVTTIHYDELGARSELRAGNGVVTNSLYEPSTRWLDVETITAPGGEELRSLDHSYDRVGNLERVIEKRPSGRRAAPFLGPVTRTYGYDDLDRLTTFSFRAAEARAGATPWSVDAAYAYDDVGNITQQTVSRTRGSSALAAYPARNWNYAYDESKPNLPDTIGPYRYSYDDRGATTDSRRKAGQPGLPHSAKYTWDDEGRLKSSQLGGSALPTKTTYTYDAAGERVRKETLLPGLCGRTRCADATIYVNPYYTARFARRAAEGRCRTGTCWEQVISRTKHVYVDGDRVAVAAEVVAADHANERALTFVSPATRQFFHVDHVGSTALLTDRFGRRSEEIDYLPFGEELFERVAIDRAALPQHYGFNGKELDAETGLQYFGARYYDPRIGRWMSADPLYLAAPDTMLQEPLRANLYGFSLDSPLGYRDETGLDPCREDKTCTYIEFEDERIIGLTPEERERIARSRWFSRSVDPLAMTNTSRLYEALGEVGLGFVGPELIAVRAVRAARAAEAVATEAPVVGKAVQAGTGAASRAFQGVRAGQASEAQAMEIASDVFRLYGSRSLAGTAAHAAAGAAPRGVDISRHLGAFQLELKFNFNPQGIPSSLISRAWQQSFKYSRTYQLNPLNPGGLVPIRGIRIYHVPSRTVLRR